MTILTYHESEQPWRARQLQIDSAADAICSGIYYTLSGITYGYGYGGRYRKYYFIWFGLAPHVSGLSTRPVMWDIHDPDWMYRMLETAGLFGCVPIELRNELARAVWHRCVDHIHWLPTDYQFKHELQKERNKEMQRWMVQNYHWEKLHYMKENA